MAEWEWNSSRGLPCGSRPGPTLCGPSIAVATLETNGKATTVSHSSVNQTPSPITIVRVEWKHTEIRETFFMIMDKPRYLYRHGKNASGTKQI